jgi:hypothetical protein
MMSQVSPGWYPDPDGKPCHRFWDGANWTLETRPLGFQNSSNDANQEMSNGWKVGIGLAFALAILVLVFISSDPSFWEY